MVSRVGHLFHHVLHVMLDDKLVLVVRELMSGFHHCTLQGTVRDVQGRQVQT